MNKVIMSISKNPPLRKNTSKITLNNLQWNQIIGKEPLQYSTDTKDDIMRKCIGESICDALRSLFLKYCQDMQNEEENNNE